MYIRKKFIGVRCNAISIFRYLLNVICIQVRNAAGVYDLDHFFKKSFLDSSINVISGIPFACAFFGKNDHSNCVQWSM
jgi:hypothetical protein